MAGTKKPLTRKEQLEQLMQQFEDVNTYYIEKVVQQIARIGELNASSMHRIEVMASMNEDIAAINRKLAQAAKMSIRSLYGLYNKALNEMYSSPRFERALRETPLPETEKQRLANYSEMVARQTAGKMINFSNTTAVSDAYRKAVDKAILASSSGMDGYKAAMRQTIRDLGYNGLQVHYESGYHRRLDTAVRQNIVDGMNQIAQHGSDMMGEALGYDAYELSAHLASAPDHEPVQGRVFLKAEFAKMQSGQPFEGVDGRQYEGFRRPIGEWNCMHIAMSFDTRRSIRRYTDEQLEQWAENNEKGCEIDGRHYTLYEARQLMRRIETQIRREKDTAVAARLAGDDELRKECQDKINALSRKYNQVAEASGFKPRRDRMQVQGFEAVKGDNNPSQTTKKRKRRLTQEEKKDKIQEEVLPEPHSMTNEETRKWYIDHDKRIPDMIDKSQPLEQQARQAHELRNNFRNMARDLMKDQELRQQLDREHPNKSFEDTLSDKMERKKMTRDEAVADILKTATKTNKEVNEKLGLEG